MSRENRQEQSRRVYLIFFAVGLLCLMHVGLVLIADGAWKWLAAILWPAGIFGTLAASRLTSISWLPVVTLIGAHAALFPAGLFGGRFLWLTWFGERPAECVVVHSNYRYSRTSASTSDYLITCGDQRYEYGPSTEVMGNGSRVDLVIDHTGLLAPQLAKYVSPNDIWWYVGGIAAVVLFIVAILTLSERKPRERNRKPATVRNDFI